MTKCWLVIVGIGCLGVSDGPESQTSRALQEIPWPTKWEGLVVGVVGNTGESAAEVSFVSAKEVDFALARRDVILHYHMCYELDPGSYPQAIDLTSVADQSSPIRGIYRLDGNVLRLCLTGGVRPSGFEKGKVGSWCWRLVLKQGRAQGGRPASEGGIGD